MEESLTTQDWKDFRQMKQDRHAAMKEKNLSIIIESGIPFINKGETLLFREPGKTKVDFYPSTGRWKFMRNGQTRIYSGGAVKFLEWYKKL